MFAERREPDWIAALCAVMNKRNEIVTQMTSVDMYRVVKGNYEVFNELYAKYQDSHTSYIDELSTLCQSAIDDRGLVESKTFEDNQRSIVQFRISVMDWCNQAEHILTDNVSVHSDRSDHSSESVHSKHSHLKSCEQVRIAELKVEKSMLKQTQELQARQKELALDIEIAKSKARMCIYSEEHNSEVSRGTIEFQADSEHNLVSGHPASTLPSLIRHDPASIWTTSSSGNVLQSTQATRTTPATSLSLMATCNPSPLYGNHISTTSSLCNASINGVSTSTVYTCPTIMSATPYTHECHQRAECTLSEQERLINVLCLPKPLVPMFSGEPGDYISFVMAFDIQISSRLSSSYEQLYYLDQHLEGEAKEVIGGCMYMNPDNGYPESRRLLQKHYGDPNKIAMVYLSKLLEWPDVHDNDNVALRRFSFLLNKCNSVMDSMSNMSLFNHAPYLQSMVQKLSCDMQERWRTHVRDIRSERHTEITFPDLVSFIDHEAEVANDPVYSTDVLAKCEQYHKFSGTKQDRRDTSSVFVTHMHNDIECAHQRRNVSVISTELCPYCERTHDLDDCIEFGNMSIASKRTFLMSKGMCFGCLGPGHFSRRCINKRICSKCNKNHPTVLHMNNFRLFR